MAEFVVLAEVEPIYGDSFETARWHYCSFCDGSPLEDAARGVPDRAYYELLGECGLVVCEHCIPDLWEG